MSLTFVNQVGAPRGMNVAAPGSFIPEDFVRWSQDVLFDRVGQLRRRAPYSTLELFNEDGTALAQPNVDDERIIGVVNTRNPANENVMGIIVTDGTNTRVLFYNSDYRKTCFCDITSVRSDSVVFSRPALNGGVFIGVLENYGTASAQNKNLLYYWRGGTGTSGYAVNTATLDLRNNDHVTANYQELIGGGSGSNNTFYTATPHNFSAGYKITVQNVGTGSSTDPWTLGQVLTVSASGLTATEFQVTETEASNNNRVNMEFVVGGHVTHTNTISGTFDATKITPGMFAYRVVGGTYNGGTNTITGGTDYYLGVVKEATSSTVTLEKDIIRTLGFNTSPHDINANQQVRFVNIRPYIHNHGRGLITKQQHPGLTVTSGTIGTEGEGHFASAGLADSPGWALYRASDGEWLGDVKSVTNNAALTLDSVYHTLDTAMNADEYVARPYMAVSETNDATSYPGIFNTTYAGYQWFGNGGTSGTENRIVFSAYHDPESVDLSRDAADSIIIPGTQQMRGIATSSSGLVIFLEDKAYLLRGNYRANFSLEELYPEGCLSAQSIVEYGGGVFWASKNGILFYDGATVRNLTESNLGAYYTDSIKTFDALQRRIYGFFYKDYLFMTFTGFASNYTPLRYEPRYASSYSATPEAQGFPFDEWDPDFTSADFKRINNVPMYWDSYRMYTSEGASDQNASGLWSNGKSYPNAVVTSGNTTITGLSGLTAADVNSYVIGYGIPENTTVLSQAGTSMVISAAPTESSDSTSTPRSSVQIIPNVPTNTWSKSLQFVWGPVNFIESMTFAIYLPSNAVTAISNFDFRGFIKLDSAGGTKGYAGINAVNPDSLTGTYARLIDVDSMLNPINDHSVTTDSELSENLGKQTSLYYKGPDFYLQTKHYPVGDPVLKKWFRQVMLNLYLLDGGIRMDIVDNEDNDHIDVRKKRRRNWEIFEESTYSWNEWENIVLPKLLSPNRSTWDNVQAENVSWYEITNAEFTRRKKKVSWRYPTAGFRLYQMNRFRPSNYQEPKRPHTVIVDSWNIGFKPMRTSRV